MEDMNGVSEGDKSGPPVPSPLTGCYLLVVVGEPHSKEHKDLILQKIAKGLLSWDISNCHVDLEKELSIIIDQAPDGEEARYGERLIQFASENLVTEILIHPAISTLIQCMKNLLSSFTRHRHVIHAGYTFAINGSWILQDGTFSLADFCEAFQEVEVQRVVRAYGTSINLDIHCSPEGDWPSLPKEQFTKYCKIRVNPDDVLNSGSSQIANFLNYISTFLMPSSMETLLESSDVVGNIRFSHPTLYVFPGGQGDAALFGINGFNMLLDGGFSRKACFWDFVRHLDRLDAVLMTRLNNNNINGISALLTRKRHNAVYPQIGHFFCNIQERKNLLSPDGDKDKDSLLINLFDEGHGVIDNLKQIHLYPQTCYRDSEPINLYHKVGHGTLDMYILNPSRDSKEVKEFLQKWNNNDQKLFASQKNAKDFTFPVPNLVSICALLIWQPSNANDKITRILYPGSTPQQKIFEGLDKLKHLDFIKHPVCSVKTVVSAGLKYKQKPEKDQKMGKIIDNKQKEIAEIKLDKKGFEDPAENGAFYKSVKKADSVESEKSETKPKDDPSNVITESLDHKEKKPKVEQKSKYPLTRKTEPKLAEKKKVSVEKKSSPTTPKKVLDAKTNGEVKVKAAPRVASLVPAKSAKDANNRKVVESKYKATPARKEVSKLSAKKEVKEEKKVAVRKVLGSSPPGRSVGSPIRKPKKEVPHKIAKLERDGTTDSSTVSTPSADQDNTFKKVDPAKFSPEELEQLRIQELADLKEEQEAVKEIEAVFRKSEQDVGSAGDLRKIKSLSVTDKTEEDEYLIIEKEVIEVPAEDKADELQKHARDSEESEKQKEQIKDPEVQTEIKQVPKETSPAVEETSSEKKVTDEVLEQNAPESQPDEKFSTIESGATTAPTLPEDERIPLDEIKEDNGDQAIEEKYVKEETKEKGVPVIQLPLKPFEAISKLAPAVNIKLDKQAQIKDLIKTPDEVADLPVHEEVDIDGYDGYANGAKAEDKGKASKEFKLENVETVKKADEDVKKPVETVKSNEVKEKESPEKEVQEEAICDKDELEKTEPKKHEAVIEKSKDIPIGTESSKLESKTIEQLTKDGDEGKKPIDTDINGRKEESSKIVRQLSTGSVNEVKEISEEVSPKEISKPELEKVAKEITVTNGEKKKADIFEVQSEVIKDIKVEYIKGQVYKAEDEHPKLEAKEQDKIDTTVKLVEDQSKLDEVNNLDVKENDKKVVEIKQNEDDAKIEDIAEMEEKPKTINNMETEIGDGLRESQEAKDKISEKLSEEIEESKINTDWKEKDEISIKTEIKVDVEEVLQTSVFAKEILKKSDKEVKEISSKVDEEKVESKEDVIDHKENVEKDSKETTNDLFQEKEIPLKLNEKVSEIVDAKVIETKPINQELKQTKVLLEVLEDVENGSDIKEDLTEIKSNQEKLDDLEKVTELIESKIAKDDIKEILHHDVKKLTERQIEIADGIREQSEQEDMDKIVASMRTDSETMKDISDKKEVLQHFDITADIQNKVIEDILTKPIIEDSAEIKIISEKLDTKTDVGSSRTVDKIKKEEEVLQKPAADEKIVDKIDDQLDVEIIVEKFDNVDKEKPEKDQSKQEKPTIKVTETKDIRKFLEESKNVAQRIIADIEPNIEKQNLDDLQVVKQTVIKDKEEEIVKSTEDSGYDTPMDKDTIDIKPKFVTTVTEHIDSDASTKEESYDKQSEVIITKTIIEDKTEISEETERKLKDDTVKEEEIKDKKHDDVDEKIKMEASIDFKIDVPKSVEEKTPELEEIVETKKTEQAIVDNIAKVDDTVKRSIDEETLILKDKVEQSIIPTENIDDGTVEKASEKDEFLLIAKIEQTATTTEKADFPDVSEDTLLDKIEKITAKLEMVDFTQGEDIILKTTQKEVDKTEDTMEKNIEKEDKIEATIGTIDSAIGKLDVERTDKVKQDVIAVGKVEFTIGDDAIAKSIKVEKTVAAVIESDADGTTEKGVKEDTLMQSKVEQMELTTEKESEKNTDKIEQSKIEKIEPSKLVDVIEKVTEKDSHISTDKVEQSKIEKTEATKHVEKVTEEDAHILTEEVEESKIDQIQSAKYEDTVKKEIKKDSPIPTDEVEQSKIEKTEATKHVEKVTEEDAHILTDEVEESKVDQIQSAKYEDTVKKEIEKDSLILMDKVEQSKIEQTETIKTVEKVAEEHVHIFSDKVEESKIEQIQSTKCEDIVKKQIDKDADKVEQGETNQIESIKLVEDVEKATEKDVLIEKDKQGKFEQIETTNRGDVIEDSVEKAEQTGNKDEKAESVKSGDKMDNGQLPEKPEHISGTEIKAEKEFGVRNRTTDECETSDRDGPALVNGKNEEQKDEILETKEIKAALEKASDISKAELPEKVNGESSDKKETKDAPITLEQTEIAFTKKTEISETKTEEKTQESSQKSTTQITSAEHEIAGEANFKTEVINNFEEKDPIPHVKDAIEESTDSKVDKIVEEHKDDIDIKTELSLAQKEQKPIDGDLSESKQKVEGTVESKGIENEANSSILDLEETNKSSDVKLDKLPDTTVMECKENKHFEESCQQEIEIKKKIDSVPEDLTRIETKEEIKATVKEIQQDAETIQQHTSEGKKENGLKTDVTEPTKSTTEDKNEDGLKIEDIRLIQSPIQQPTTQDKTQDGLKIEDTKLTQSSIQQPTTKDKIEDGLRIEDAKLKQSSIQQPTTEDKIEDAKLKQSSIQQPTTEDKIEDAKLKQSSIQQPTTEDKIENGLRIEDAKLKQSSIQQSTTEDKIENGLRIEDAKLKQSIIEDKIDDSLKINDTEHTQSIIQQPITEDKKEAAIKPEVKEPSKDDVSKLKDDHSMEAVTQEIQSEQEPLTKKSDDKSEGPTSLIIKDEETLLKDDKKEGIIVVNAKSELEESSVIGKQKLEECIEVPSVPSIAKKEEITFNEQAIEKRDDLSKLKEEIVKTEVVTKEETIIAVVSSKFDTDAENIRIVGDQTVQPDKEKQDGKISEIKEEISKENDKISQDKPVEDPKIQIVASFENGIVEKIDLSDKCEKEPKIKLSDEIKMEEDDLQDKDFRSDSTPPTEEMDDTRLYSPNVSDRSELGRKSPKEREEDVAKIVASVAEVLKSDAPLEELEDKIPLEIRSFTPILSKDETKEEEKKVTVTTAEETLTEFAEEEATGYTTKLRETHIGLRSGDEDIPSVKISEPECPINVSLFLEEERKVAAVHMSFDSRDKSEDEDLQGSHQRIEEVTVHSPLNKVQDTTAELIKHIAPPAVPASPKPDSPCLLDSPEKSKLSTSTKSLDEEFKGDEMTTSLYGELPDHSLAETEINDTDSVDGDSLVDGGKSPLFMYETTTAKYLEGSNIEEPQAARSDLAEPKTDPIEAWGKPLHLPSPAPILDNKGTPKKEKKVPASVIAKNKLNEEKKYSDVSKRLVKKVSPVYVDLTYVPHHGNSRYCYTEFFKRIRARYYVFSGIEPSRDVYNALLEAKQTWEDKDLEVTIIPTYDTDVLGYWVAENEDLLAKHKIDLSPSASRCTINLQDHETSCSAYRLEFS